MQFDTKYNYVVGIGNTARQFWFTTPPKSGPDVPYTFGLIGSQALVSIFMKYFAFVLLY